VTRHIALIGGKKVLAPKNVMRKVLSALSEAERACFDLAEAISVAKDKKVPVLVAEVEQFVAGSRRLQALLEEAVKEQEEEEDKEEVEQVRPKEIGRSKRNSGGEVSKSSNSTTRLQREKRVKRKLRDGEEKAPPKEPPQKRRQKDKEEGALAVAVVLSVKKGGQVKNGGVGRGPEGELVFYIGGKGVKAVQCPVFGKELEEVFGEFVRCVFVWFVTDCRFEIETKSLVPCDLDAL
jgi:hypothetical protein